MNHRHSERQRSRLTHSLLAGSALTLGLLAAPRAAHAATITRTIANETDLYKLFTDANADPTNTYQGNLSQRTYLLTTHLNLTKGKVVLRGGASVTTAANYVLDCQNNCRSTGGPGRVLTVSRASGYSGTLSVQLWGVTVTRGYSTESGLRGGGGALVEGGVLEIHDSVISKNKANQWGAGLLAGNQGVLNVLNSMVEDNQNDQITSQTCGFGVTSAGGGIAGAQGSWINIVQSSVTGNKACYGGGIVISGSMDTPSQLIINNSTISGNAANHRGGGIYVWGVLKRLEIGMSTIAYNKGGAGLVTSPESWGGGIGFYGFGLTASSFVPPVKIWGTVIANNTLDWASFNSGYDCYTDTAIPSVLTGVSGNYIGKVGNCQDLLTYDGTTGGTTLIGTESAPLDPRISSALTSTPVPPKAHIPLSTSSLLNRYVPGQRLRGMTAPSCPIQDITKRNRGSSGTTAPPSCDIGAYEQTAGL